jgi:predicted alpha/beta hydrolase family esterase
MDSQKEEVLLIPGLYNSGPKHWQSLWQTEFGFTRLEQKDWETPRCEDWVDALESTVMASAGRVVLVAHSLGCILVTQWALHSAFTGKVEAAMLVAPSDAERSDFPAGTTGFAPIPMRRLPFRSSVIASGNDRYTPFWRATDLADAWGSELIDAGDCGHITAVDGYGPWPEGLTWLELLRG